MLRLARRLMLVSVISKVPSWCMVTRASPSSANATRTQSTSATTFPMLSPATALVPAASPPLSVSPPNATGSARRQRFRIIRQKHSTANDRWPPFETSVTNQHREVGTRFPLALVGTTPYTKLCGCEALAGPNVGSNIARATARSSKRAKKSRTNSNAPGRENRSVSSVIAAIAATMRATQRGSIPGCRPPDFHRARPAGPISRASYRPCCRAEWHLERHTLKRHAQ